MESEESNQDNQWHALQRLLRIRARLVLHAVAPLSLQRSVKRPNRRRQRSSVRNKAAQYLALLGAIGSRQRNSVAVASTASAVANKCRAAVTCTATEQLDGHNHISLTHRDLPRACKCQLLCVSPAYLTLYCT